MKKILFILVLSFVFKVSIAQNANFNYKDYLDSAIYQKALVIELFSSEGCGSCPFADEFLKEVIAISDSTKSLVYVLDFHVDVWNRSGWVDAYSDSVYTKRQEWYVSQKNWKNVYTPMAILNGVQHTAGHNRPEVGNFINSNFEKPSKYFVRIGVRGKDDKDSLYVSYKIWGRTDSLVINAALVKRNISTSVTAGENIGKTLQHHNVVKAFNRTKVNSENGIVPLHFNRFADLSDYRIIAYIQHQRTLEVLGADQINFSDLLDPKTTDVKK